MTAERVIPVPDPLKRKYLLKSKDRDRGLVRIVPELRQMVCFRRLNFMDDDFGFREMIDVIFCRNVIIYFDRPTQTRLLNKFYRQMVPGGYLFMGHSETLHGLDVPLVQVTPDGIQETGMIDGNGKLPLFYLKPGEMHIADRPGSVTTVLGSCISVTMYNPRLKMGAICHGMMPRWVERRDGRGKSDERFKYVDYSIRYMVEAFRSFGIGPREIEAKLFGGADMFSSGGDEIRYLSVGKQNIMKALEVMGEEGLTVKKRDIGGTQGRKLHFYLHTGAVFLKRLKPSESSRIIRMQTEGWQMEAE